MRRREQPCRWRAAIKAHSPLSTVCDICGNWRVAFHWRATYPQLVLCANCVEDFRADIDMSALRVVERYQRLYRSR